MELYWGKVLILSMQQFCFSSPQVVPSMFTSGVYITWASEKILVPRGGDWVSTGRDTGMQVRRCSWDSMPEPSQGKFLPLPVLHYRMGIH